MGNSADFGDLTVARFIPGGCSNSTRGVFGGGSTPTSTNTIDYITISTLGNALDFGDLTVTRTNIHASCASSIRGVWGGGYIAPVATNIIDYVTLYSTGNAIDFGDLITSTFYAAACSNGHGGLG